MEELLQSLKYPENFCGTHLTWPWYTCIGGCIQDTLNRSEELHPGLSWLQRKFRHPHPIQSTSICSDKYHPLYSLQTSCRNWASLRHLPTSLPTAPCLKYCRWWQKFKRNSTYWACAASLISKSIPKLRQYNLIHCISKGNLIRVWSLSLMFQFMTHLEGKSLNFVLIFPWRGKIQLVLLRGSQVLSPHAHTSSS